MYHDLPRAARFWSVLLAIDQDLAEMTRKGHSPPASRATAPQTELLLRSRRLQEENDTAVAALPRPKGLRRRCDHRNQRHAARADATPSPRVVQAIRRRPADHRSLASLLARALSADTVLEGRTGPPGAGCQDCYPSLLARGCLPRPPSPLQGLDAPASVSLTDHDPGTLLIEFSR
jgi:hypothetical protein